MIYFLIFINKKRDKLLIFVHTHHTCIYSLAIHDIDSQNSFSYLLKYRTIWKIHDFFD